LFIILLFEILNLLEFCYLKFVISHVLRERVIPSLVKRITSAYSPRSLHSTPNYPILLNRIISIRRTSRMKPTKSLWKQMPHRPMIKRKRLLVKTY